MSAIANSIDLYLIFQVVYLKQSLEITQRKKIKNSETRSTHTHTHTDAGHVTEYSKDEKEISH